MAPSNEAAILATLERIEALLLEQREGRLQERYPNPHALPADAPPLRLVKLRRRFGSLNAGEIGGYDEATALRLIFDGVGDAEGWEPGEKLQELAQQTFDQLESERRMHGKTDQQWRVAHRAPVYARLMDLLGYRALPEATRGIVNGEVAAGRV